MTTDVATKAVARSGRGRVEALLLTLGIVAPPVLWMAQLFALFMLEDFIACTPAAQPPGVILGFGVRSLALSITAVLALGTLGAGVVSVVLLKRLRHRDGQERARWMAVAGIMNSILFLAVILIKVAAPLLLGVCEDPV